MVKTKRLTVWGMAAAVFLVLMLSPFASSSPDGLERVAIDAGFIDQETHAELASPLPGYEVGLLGSSAVSTFTAGVAGVCVTLVIMVIGSRLYLRLSKKKQAV